MNSLTIENISELVLTLQGDRVILDADVAKIYGVETKRINEAVKNNPEKFPSGYILYLSQTEWDSLKLKISSPENLRSKFSTTNLAKVRYTPTAFTEKGLYMLATILKSKAATQATLMIVETFAKLRELQRTMQTLSETSNKPQQKSLMKQSGEIMAELLADNLKTDATETAIELNFAVLKFKHTIKRKK